MKILVGICLSLAVAIWLYFRYAALGATLRWLRAETPSHDALWERVRAQTALAAGRLRVAVPVLRVIPDFSPNAVIFRNRGVTTLCLTDGLVRVLGAEELEAVVSLCLTSAARPSWGWQTAGSLVLFPFARWVEGLPTPLKILLSPVLAVLLRVFCRSGAVFAADEAAAKMHGPWRVAASLQKLSVLGRKLPPKRWNLALDSLFVVGPFALDEGPQWFSLAQPSVPDRRARLLGPSCESPAALP